MICSRVEGPQIAEGIEVREKVVEGAAAVDYHALGLLIGVTRDVRPRLGSVLGVRFRPGGVHLKPLSRCAKKNYTTQHPQAKNAKQYDEPSTCLSA